MSVEKVTPILNISDMAESFAWFEKLGWQRAFSWNGGGMIGDGADAPTENVHGPADFGGVCQGSVSIFLCVGAQGSRGTIIPRHPRDDGTDGVWMTWWVSSKQEVDELHAVAVENGMTIARPPTEEPWGVRECHLRHPDGHTMRISCGL